MKTNFEIFTGEKFFLSRNLLRAKTLGGMPRFFAEEHPLNMTWRWLNSWAEPAIKKTTCLTLAEVNAKAIGEEVPRLVEFWHQLLEVGLVCRHVAPGLGPKNSNILMKINYKRRNKKNKMKQRISIV